MLWIEVLFISKTLWYSICVCVRNTLKTVTSDIGKMKLVYFSLFLDAFPLDALWTVICRDKHIQHA